MPNRPNSGVAGWAGVAFSLMLFSTLSSADVLDSAVQTEQDTNQSTRQSQTRINALAEETEDLVAEYRRVLRETESLRVYNDQLERVVDNQRSEITAVNRQLEQLEATNRGVVPLLIDMIDTLEQIVEADVPFQLEQRRNVVLDLQNDVYRADVTTSEKYRRVMDAYQREIDMGRNTFSYTGKLPDTDRTVNFLVVGRTLLLYQSLDGESVGWWNPISRAWEDLDDSYVTPVTHAVRMANNQEAYNLVKLPVPAAGGAQ
ncbi:MAG: DUF3450 domain-containing protein [Pseudomonadota bacterium]